MVGKLKVQMSNHHESGASTRWRASTTKGRREGRRKRGRGQNKRFQKCILTSAPSLLFTDPVVKIKSPGFSSHPELCHSFPLPLPPQLEDVREGHSRFKDPFSLTGTFFNKSWLETWTLAYRHRGQKTRRYFLPTFSVSKPSYPKCPLSPSRERIH